MGGIRQIFTGAGARDNIDFPEIDITIRIIFHLPCPSDTQEDDIVDATRRHDMDGMTARFLLLDVTTFAARFQKPYLPAKTVANNMPSLPRLLEY